MKGGAELVFIASIANGGTLTLTGTLTENAAAPNGFTWAATPNDRMIVNFSGGQTLVARFAAFQGFLGGTFEDFVDFHSNLDFTVALAGSFDLRVRSASGNPAAPDLPGTASPAGVTVFERRVTGTFLSEGESLVVDLTHTGRRDSDISGGSIDFLSEESTGGTITAPGGQITVDATYRYRLVRFDNFVENVTRTVNSQVVAGGVTWKFDNAFVRKAYFNNRVSEPDFWVAQGTLRRNGQPEALVRFDRPVLNGDAFPGPRAELAFSGGEVVPLAPSLPGRTPGQDPQGSMRKRPVAIFDGVSRR